MNKIDIIKLFNKNNNDFDNYLRKLGYKFKNNDNEFGGYTILRNKKICLIIDSGSSPDFKFTKDYQSGALSFEIILPLYSFPMRPSQEG